MRNNLIKLQSKNKQKKEKRSPFPIITHCNEVANMRVGHLKIIILLCI
ncbi:hypothetical protein PROPEN_01673 [Proteus penneri ATCC 35198]|nr:hypothetical protein PROPEN_01673 [Proteus penneri ATCC 35198]